MTVEEGVVAHPLAHRDGIALVAVLLLDSGALCSACGYGTRATSKRWARCKRCGTRVPRRDLAESAARVRAIEEGRA